MNTPWKIYDELINGIPEEITVKYYQGGSGWSRVISSEDNMGLAMSYHSVSRPSINSKENLDGSPLREVAKLVKSWNFVEASIGLAAINSYYNQLERAEQCGFVHPSKDKKSNGAFDVYFEEAQGKKVGLIGHFPSFEKRFEGKCDLSIIERNPSWGDYPDSASEYLLPEQDYVFITGSTLVNKTFPRLIELAKNAKVVIVGPSTTLSTILFDNGIYGLSGFIAINNDKLEHTLKGASDHTLFESGLKTDQILNKKL